ncbi:MAG TPA: hypothetical protein VH500_00480 [Nitrososphaeraceae archaeon]|jgi:hypothetical protein
MNLSRIQSVIPFISFPIGVTSIILLIIEFDVRMTVIVNNPISQLILFAGIMTNISMSLLSFRAITQVLSEKNRMRHTQKGERFT